MQKLHNFIVLSFMSLVFAGCELVAHNGNKIQITSKSEEARENFVAGRDLQERLRVAESLPYLKKAVELDPDFALAHMNLALAQPTAKAFFASLSRAAGLAEKVSEGERLWILGLQAGVNGKPVQQRQYFTQLVEKYPEDERAHNVLGGHYFGQQQYEKAIQEYESAVKLNPQFSPPYNQMGYAYRFLGHYDLAKKTFQRYIELLPDDPNPYDSYAELLLKIGEYDASIKNYRKALSVNPDFFASYLGMATAYDCKGDYPAARAALEELEGHVQNTGQRRAALFAAMVSFVYEGSLEQALKAQESQFDLASEGNDAAAMAGDLRTTGTILLEFGHPLKAAQEFKQAHTVVQHSTLPEAQKALADQAHLFDQARVAIAQKDWAAAKHQVEEYERNAEARQNQFQLWNAHQLAGSVALGEGKPGMAVAEFKQSNLQNPYNLYRLAVAYEAAGETELGRETLHRAQNFNALNSLNQALVAYHSRRRLSMK